MTNCVIKPPYIASAIGSEMTGGVGVCTEDSLLTRFSECFAKKNQQKVRGAGRNFGPRLRWLGGVSGESKDKIGVTKMVSFRM